MSQYRVAVVGVGMVGTELVRVLRQRNFPCSKLQILARRARTETIDGNSYEVLPTTAEAFSDIDIALFAGTEGEKGASQLYGWEAVRRGAIVVDNGADFRLEPNVPLVVPEVNADALKSHQGFIANPNCSTIQMVVALAPLHRAAGIKRIVVSTFQAVSGTGSQAVEELKSQIADVPAGRKPKVEAYPHQIFNNVIPQIGGEHKDYPGYTSEEVKMIVETRKIIGDQDIQVSATCVRVPILNAHSESINVELNKKLSLAQVKEILASAPGVKVIDDLRSSKYPLAMIADGRDDVFVGRIRKDPSCENAFDLWCVADNIRKGAALNAVQIAEKMIEMGLIKK
ncbi:MAG TPA: aspartate-semialdehyde dehydrogenase [Candidatus Brocadiia bacterium]|nr:aspartate-semialdehyde dehydrogenase [Candidatus Brocadiia bacterium]